ncbi:hypothetical protein ACJJIU_03740 [Microbulbifer sp. CnH-101-E]|uniref:hypothetical protein n=1 Tax=unclassified Microbulbifer TaxID=2619833 RepID=UPI004039A51A
MIEFESKQIVIDGKKFSLPRSILDAEEINGKIFVVYDYMEYPTGEAANNLVCLDKSGTELWVAKNPTNQGNDGYTNFSRTTVSEAGFIAVNNFAGYVCQVNKTNGELGHVQFTK